MAEFDLIQAKKKIYGILDEKPQNRRGHLPGVVRGIRDKSARILKMAKKYGTPFYLLDGEKLQRNLRGFRESFRHHVPRFRPFYAIKANDHPLVLYAAVRQGYGLEAASGRELDLALGCGAKQILFSGPGKTPDEHKLALKNGSRVIVNLDSFGELERLGRLAAARRKRIRAGIRVYQPSFGGWLKFGIPLADLGLFWTKAEKHEYLDLQGIQFHVSWNRDPSRHAGMIRDIAAYLKKSFNRARLRGLKFIDMGGGFYPGKAEGYYPWTAHYPGAWPGGKIVGIADAYLGTKTDFEADYYITDAVPVRTFAREIGQAVRRWLEPLVKCEYYAEPGRIIVNDVMHVVTSLVDCKRKDFVIADGGVNIIGWEYGESFYYPMVNLTHPSEKEIRCTVAGPLCTPHDIWGYFCHASKMEDGDVIVVSNQGAYKYVLSQDFIKPVPPVRLLSS